MNDRLNKPWPHSPAVIAKVEEYDDQGSLKRAYYEVRSGSAVGYAATYEDAQRAAVDVNTMAARPSYLPRDRAQAEAGVRPTLADELSA